MAVVRLGNCYEISRLEAQKQYREKKWQLIGTYDAYLYPVGGFKHLDCFPFHIWDVILPIDELHHVSNWLLHHQPDTY